MDPTPRHPDDPPDQARDADGGPHADQRPSSALDDDAPEITQELDYTDEIVGGGG
jgi:hypothetical protein